MLNVAKNQTEQIKVFWHKQCSTSVVAYNGSRHSSSMTRNNVNEIGRRTAAVQEHRQTCLLSEIQLTFKVPVDILSTVTEI